MGLFSKKKKKAPPPPDYVALAKQDAENQLKLLEAQTVANRANQVGPYGSKTWEKDPATGKWTETVAFDPRIQKLADTQMAQAAKLQGGLDKLMDQEKFQGPEAIKRIGAMAAFDPEVAGKYGEQFTESLLARVRPEQQEAERQMETKLRLQGLQPGSEAYNRAYQNLLTSHGDVRAQAQLQGMLAGGKEARDIYASQLAGYGANLSEYQAALQGQGQEFDQSMQQYQMPWQQAQMAQALSQGGGANQFQMDFGGYNTAEQGKAANLQEAEQAAYAAKMQAYNEAQKKKSGMMSSVLGIAGGVVGGMFGGPVGASLGSSLGSSVGGSLSDERLKNNIEVIDDEAAYNAMLLIQPRSFTWPDGKRASGLIAQEVAKHFPHLVKPQEQGFFTVDYQAFNALLLGAFRHLAKKEKEHGLPEQTA